MSARPVLAYWDIRGLAQPIRLLLEYTGTDYEDKHYICGPAPNFDKSCWFDVKYTLGLDFPNLPYYIDGDVKLCQSGAIMRYIARKHNLCGTTEKERYRADFINEVINDLRNSFVMMCYSPDFEKKKPGYLKTLPDHLKQFSSFLGTNSYFAGDHITFPDFIVYEMLDQHLLMAPGCLDGFPNLKDFHKRIDELDAIKKYKASPRCIKHRLNNRMARSIHTSKIYTTISAPAFVCSCDEEV